MRRRKTTWEGLLERIFRMEEDRHGAVWKAVVSRTEESPRWTVELWTNISGLADRPLDRPLDGPYKFHARRKHEAFEQAVFFMIWDYLPYKFGFCEVRANDKFEISLWLETMGA